MVARQTGSRGNNALPAAASDWCVSTQVFSFPADGSHVPCQSVQTMGHLESAHLFSGDLIMSRCRHALAVIMLLLVLPGCQMWKPFGLAKNSEDVVEKKDSRFSLPKFSRKNDPDTSNSEKSSEESATANARQVKELLKQGENALRIAAASDPASEQQLNEAKRMYREVLEIEHGNASAHHGLAMVADLTENWGDAEYHYKQALKNRPGDANLLSDLGYSYVLQSRYAEAAGYLNQAIEVDPDHDGAHINLALLDIRQGKKAAAEQRIFQRHGRTPYAADLLAGLEQQAFPDASGSPVEGKANQAIVAAPNAKPGPGMSFDQIQELARLEKERSEQQRIQKYTAGRQVSVPEAWDKAERLISQADDHGNPALSAGNSAPQMNRVVAGTPAPYQNPALVSQPVNSGNYGDRPQLPVSYGAPSDSAGYGQSYPPGQSPQSYAGLSNGMPPAAVSSTPSQELQTARWPSATPSRGVPAVSAGFPTGISRQNISEWQSPNAPQYAQNRTEEAMSGQHSQSPTNTQWTTENSTASNLGGPLEQPIPIRSGHSGLAKGSVSYGQPAGFFNSQAGAMVKTSPASAMGQQPSTGYRPAGAQNGGALRLEGLNVGPGSLFPVAQADTSTQGRGNFADPRNMPANAAPSGVRQNSIQQSVLPAGFSVSDANGTRTGPARIRSQPLPPEYGQMYDQQQDADSMQEAMNSGAEAPNTEEFFFNDEDRSGNPEPNMNQFRTTGQGTPSALNVYEQQLQQLNSQFNNTLETMEQP